jgi:5'-nucleotidase
MSDPAPVTIAPRVTFSAADPAVTGFQCRASSAGSATAWTPCTAADGYAPDLPGGAWDLTVQAIGAEGVTQQMTRHTVVDRTAPTITFGAGPAEKATIHTAATQLGFTSTDANPGPSSCTVDGSPRPSCISPIALSGMGNGAHAVTVTSTDAAGNTATATRHFTVALATTLTAGNVTATYGHAAALTARISPAGATGTVVFTAAGRTLCTAKLVAGVARCSAAAGLVAGRYSVTARYSGPYAASTTGFGLTVAKAAPRMTVRAASPTVRHGRSETITASGLPAGRVTVTRGSRTLCRAAVVRGTARCTFRVALPAGRYVLTVRYAGNANYLPAQRTIRITVKR